MRRLVSMALLLTACGPAATVRRVSAPAPDAVRAPAERAVDPSRSGTMVWLGSQLAPARPQGPRGVPALAAWVFSRPEGAHPAAIVELTFRGPAAPDDQAAVRLPDGREAHCPVRPLPALEGRGQGATARCVFDGEGPWPTRGSAQVAYTPRLTGEPTPLGALDLAPDARSTLIWLAFLPTPVRENPVTHERPWLVFLDAAEPRDLSARCAVNGETVGGTIRGQATAEEADGLRRFHLPLPVSVPREPNGPPADADLPPAAQRAGRWRCVVSQAAAPLRTIEFTLQPDGRPDASAPTGLISPPWWPLEPQ
ncbi:MAG: hypothetical protein KC613_12585 [Myxococcales bacterium]|nr:hypothetical protein [Myxococcales bacterium]MCB9526758.1 hypothetical protein [Myxococcales bacterium]